VKPGYAVTLAAAGLCLAFAGLAIAKDGGGVEDGGEEARDPNIVRITIRTEPEVRAEVKWGRQVLGRTPLLLERPRDSGPMDIVLTAPRYLTVRTRIYTFEDDRVFVRMTREADKHLIFGYRKPPPDAGVLDGGAPDGGVGDGGTSGGEGGGATGGGGTAGGRRDGGTED